MIEYRQTAEGIRPAMLEGFFVGWPNKPSPSTHMRLLVGSEYVVLAIDTEVSRVVGFITAISDGVLSAYIPLLEVLPGFQKRGIGQQLMQRMLDQLSDYYMVDLMCNADRQSFYEQTSMWRSTGMSLRRMECQSGKK